MPVKNFLSQEQKQSLQQALRESEQPELRERVLMLLLMNEGELIIKWGRKIKNKGNAVNAS